MPNRLTRVPDRPVPPLPAGAGWLLSPADLFMVLMVSRPPSGTLGSTWVTPGTLILCVVVVLLAGPLVGVALVAGLAGGHLGKAVAGLIALPVVLGCCAVAVVGILQRRRG